MRIVTALSEVSDAIGKSMAQVALNWVVTQPGIGAAIIGASKLAQLDDNLGALAFAIPDELRKSWMRRVLFNRRIHTRFLLLIIRQVFSIRVSRLAISPAGICLRNLCRR